MPSEQRGCLFLAGSRTRECPHRFCFEGSQRASEKAMRQGARDQAPVGRLTPAELPQPGERDHLPTRAPPFGAAITDESATSR
jgi:hypothetical protein